MRSLAAAVLCLGFAAYAEDDAQRRAREELERQLHQMVGTQATRIRVDLEGLDEPNFELKDASFELDGKGLPAPALQQLAADGTHLVWNGDVSPGSHVVGARLVYTNKVSPVVSEEGGRTWKVAGTVSFELQKGIEVRVKVSPFRDGKQKDIGKRLNIRMPSTPVMLSQLDDGSMPEPMAKKVDAVDAGTGAAVVVTGAAAMTAAEKKAAAAEAKRLKAEEKQRKAEEAAEAKRLKAEERKRKAEEAREAKRLAAQGKKPVVVAVAEPIDAGPPPPEEPDAGAPVEEIDAGPPMVAEVVDAGPPVVAAPAEEEAGPPWGIIGAVGAGLILLLIILLARRRRSRAFTIDE